MSEYRAGDFVFELRQSARRKAIEITVKRDGHLVLDVPEGVDEVRLCAFVEAKQGWLYTKLAEREKRGGMPEPKRYLDGEGFLYLGRSYRLRTVDAGEKALALDHGRFMLLRSALPVAAPTFRRWYSQHVRIWLEKYARYHAPRLSVEYRALQVRDLGFRWGSCGKGQVLYFHWKTALLPLPLIEYIVVHELAHLMEARHTPAFWLLVERAIPDYEQRMARLEAMGIEVENAV